ncbi:MAG: DKNYY domain-containing protein [Allomuricauda sp.]
MSWQKLIELPEQKVERPSYGSTIIYWKIEDGKIWHQWKKLSSADIESFEIYEDKDFIARDKNHIYHGWSKMTKIDRNTFEKVVEPYWTDKNYAYCEHEDSLKPLKGMDASSFTYLENGFAYDKYYAYYYGSHIKSCLHPTTLKVVKENNLFARDKENIYFETAVLKNVDIKEWRLLTDCFSSDGKSIFYTARKLPKVDVNTWEHLYKAYSKDKNRVYCMELIEKDKSPKDWNKAKIIEHYYN